MGRSETFRTTSAAPLGAFRYFCAPLPNVYRTKFARRRADGKRLVFHTTAPGDPLFVREAERPGIHADRMIYVAPGGVHCHFPTWSPDGVFIYFVRGVPPDNWDSDRLLHRTNRTARLRLRGARLPQSSPRIHRVAATTNGRATRTRRPLRRCLSHQCRRSANHSVAGSPAITPGLAQAHPGLGAHG